MTVFALEMDATSTSLRRYRRFRAARFYGGIATADCVGCNLHCVFCWSYREIDSPKGAGEMLRPAEVAGRLVRIAWRRGFAQVRISGNEPTLKFPHLLEVLSRVPPDFRFILETNGLVLGEDPAAARELARFKNLQVRVSLKGCTPEEFHILTAAPAEKFGLQVRAIENLVASGVSCHAAAMTSFSPRQSVRSLMKELRRIQRGLADIEEEEIVLYGGVEERLRAAGLWGMRGGRQPILSSPCQP